MFTTDSRTEKFLDFLGVKWKYTNEMTFAMLRQQWDLLNFGRSEVVIQAAVDEYGSLMDKGSPAPAPIVWRNEHTGLYDVLDGIQRMLAEEARKPSVFSAYIALTDSAAIMKRIRIFANYRLQGGYQESSEWTLEQAIIELVNKGEMSVEELADYGGWTPSAVRDKKQCIDFRLCVRDIGGPEKIPDSLSRIVSRVAVRDDFGAAAVPISQFFNDMERMRLTSSEAEPYVEQFFAVGRSRGKVFDQFRQKLEEFRKDDDVVVRLDSPFRKRFSAMTGEGKLHKSLRAAITVANAVLRKAESVPDLDEYFQMVSQLRKILQQIETVNRKRKVADGQPV